MSVGAERQMLGGMAGTFTLPELYAALEAADLTNRAAGDDVVHGRTDTRARRRLRGALQTLKRKGRARRLGRSVWVIDGAPEAPRLAVLVSLVGSHRDIELRLQSAAELLADLDDPADLVLADPPYALQVGCGYRRDVGERTYARDGSRVVGGYREISPSDYRAFTTEWVTAAAAALRPGGHLVVVTGPQQSARVQVVAEDAGLEYVNKVAVGRMFPLRTTRRFAHAHWDVTIMCRGPVRSRRRVFNAPPQLPKARSGRDYPLDHWPIGLVGRADAKPGELRYSNSLPVRLVDMLVGAFTRASGPVPDLVVDPFVGGGTTALVALLRGLRFVGGDENPAALAFTARRLTADLLTH